MLSGPPSGRLLSKLAATKPSILNRSGDRIASAMAQISSISFLASESMMTRICLSFGGITGTFLAFGSRLRICSRRCR